MYEGQGKLVMVKVLRHGFRKPEGEEGQMHTFAVDDGDVGDPILLKEGIFVCGTLSEEVK